MNQTVSPNRPHLPAAIAREAVLRGLNTAYHNGTPEASDAHYDELWCAHQQDRIDLGDWWDWPTILDEVGAAPQKSSGFRKVKHRNKMLSINDVFEGEGDAQYSELLGFVLAMEAKLGDKAWPMQVESKVDGLAVKLIYSNSLLEQGLTRGDGEVGDLITDNLRISGIVPQAIRPDEPFGGTQANPLNADHLEVVGEVYMPLEAFAAANAEREAEGLQLWANPRNAAAGALKLQDAEELKRRPLAFVRHDSETPWINGMETVGTIMCHNFEQLTHAVEVTRHAELPWAKDGAVIKLGNLEAREIAGMGTRAPNWACAFKFLPVQVDTILEEIIVQVGRTGALTPKARLKPVLLDGTTVEFATLNNEDHINRLFLQIGDKVVLQRAGMVIPEITESIPAMALLRELEAQHYLAMALEGLAGLEEVSLREVRDDNGFKDMGLEEFREFWKGKLIAKGLQDARDELGWRIPKFSLSEHLNHKCPSCGSTNLEKKQVAGEDGVKLYCMNGSGCPAQLARRIEHFCSRGCLDIEGIGKEASIALAGLLAAHTSPRPPTLLDICDLGIAHYATLRWTTASGGVMTFGAARAQKAKDALERAKKLPLHKWLRALGIHTIGENTSKEISRLCPDMPSFRAECHSAGVIYALAQDDDKAKEIRAKYHVNSRLGPVSAQEAVRWVADNLDTVNRMCAMGFKGIQSDNYDPIPVASDAKPLFGKVFAITGTLSVGRDEMKALIESKGGKVTNSISTKLTALICGEGGGGKRDKAAAKGIATLDEAGIRELF